MASGIVVILGTGGTIAGTAASASDQVGYSAAQLSVQTLVDAVPALARWPIETEQIAQVDSKDMSSAIWRSLAQRVTAHLARPEVSAVVITHGTDTLEETAYFLHRVLHRVLAASGKPVVLTAAMRPATSLHADGPQNLLDAVTLALEPGATGVVAVMAGRVCAGVDLRKVHSHRIDAFDAGDAGPVALIEDGAVRRFRDWPVADGLGLDLLRAGDWPFVEIVTSHADARGETVDALVSAGAVGIVVAGTGNGSVHATLEAALLRAQAAGVAVLRCSRCAYGGVVNGGKSSLPSAAALTPPQARVELMLRLLAAQPQAR